jgi:hypothetical protein
MHISTPFALVGTLFAGPARCRTSLTRKFMSTKGWKAWLSGEDLRSKVPRIGLPPPAVAGPPVAGVGEGATYGASPAERGVTSAGGGAPR